MELNPGTRLGRYVLEDAVGQGSEGRVFFARQFNDADPDGTPCVVKIAKDIDEEGRRRFLSEAKKAMELGSCANIVQVIDAVMVDDTPFFAMEFIDGIDLRRLLAHQQETDGKPLPLPLVFPILKGIADGLYHAHEKRKIGGKPLVLIHRDIKPANTFITVYGDTKLLDFGISTRADAHQSGRHLFGTYRYMSPEHVQGNVCPAMDIYSLGVVAWEMLEGRAFHAGLRGEEILPLILAGGPPPALQRADIPPELKTLVERSLSFDPRDRPSALNFSRALAQCPGSIFDPTLVAELVVRALGREPRSRRTMHFDIASFLPEAAAVSPPAEPSLLNDDDAPTVARPPRPEATILLDDSPTRLREPEPDAPRQLRRPKANPIVLFDAPSERPGGVHQVVAPAEPPPTEPAPRANNRRETAIVPPPPPLEPPPEASSTGLPALTLSLPKLLLFALTSILLGGGVAWLIIEGGLPW